MTISCRQAKREQPATRSQHLLERDLGNLARWQLPQLANLLREILHLDLECGNRRVLGGKFPTQPAILGRLLMRQRRRIVMTGRVRGRRSGRNDSCRCRRRGGFGSRRRCSSCRNRSSGLMEGSSARGRKARGMVKAVVWKGLEVRCSPGRRMRIAAQKSHVEPRRFAHQ